MSTWLMSRMQTSLSQTSKKGDIFTSNVKKEVTSQVQHWRKQTPFNQTSHKKSVSWTNVDQMNVRKAVRSPVKSPKNLLQMILMSGRMLSFFSWLVSEIPSSSHTRGRLSSTSPTICTVCYILIIIHDLVIWKQRITWHSITTKPEQNTNFNKHFQWKDIPRQWWLVCGWWLVCAWRSLCLCAIDLKKGVDILAAI